MHNVQFNGTEQDDDYEDIVVVDTPGNITFRMWDIQTCAPENNQKEILKRMFGGYTRKAPEVPMNWDFLLDG